MARRAQHTEVDQAGAHGAALLGLLGGQPVAERPVGITQAEPPEDLGVVDLAADQIAQGLGRVQQRGVVVVENLGEDRLVLGRDVERRGEPSRHRPLGNGGTPARGDHWRHAFS